MQIILAAILLTLLCGCATDQYVVTVGPDGTIDATGLADGTYIIQNPTLISVKDGYVEDLRLDTNTGKLRVYRVTEEE